MIRDIIIIGSGPAGYTAAIYAGRADLRPLVIEGTQPGGQLTTTTLVENFPGFPEGIQGPDLMSAMRRQAEKFGAEFLSGEVTGIRLRGLTPPPLMGGGRGRVDLDTIFSPSPQSSPIKGEEGRASTEIQDAKKALPIHEVAVGNKKLLTRALIIASGSRARHLEIPGEKKYLGRGVSTCAVCDGAFFKNKKVLVVGGGDSAGEESTFLTKFAGSVALAYRRGKDELKMSKRLQEKVFADKKINELWNTEVVEVLGDGTRMTGVKIKNIQTGKIIELKTDGMFLAIGHTPNTEFLTSGGSVAPSEPVPGARVADRKDAKFRVSTNELGYIVTRDLVKTNIPGVFAAGDVGDNYRWWQAITSAGSGCAAALEAERFLKNAD